MEKTYYVTTIQNLSDGTTAKSLFDYVGIRPALAAYYSQLASNYSNDNILEAFNSVTDIEGHIIVEQHYKLSDYDQKTEEGSN